MKVFFAIIRAPVWWRSKIVPAVSAAVFTVAISGPPERDLGELGISTGVYLFTLLTLAVFGHLANDLSDRELDAQVGKSKPSQAIRLWQIVPFIIALPAMGLSLVIFIERDLELTAVWVTTFLIAAVYSLRPFRLKARGVWGWWASAFAQRLLPVVLAILTFGDWTKSLTLLALYSLVAGLRFIIIHQLEDLDSDSSAGVPTGAVRIGRERTIWILSRIAWPTEIVVMGTFVVFVGIENLILGLLVLTALLTALLDSRCYGYFSIENQPLGVRNTLLASFLGVYFPTAVGGYLLVTSGESWPASSLLLILTLPVFFRRLRFIINKLTTS